ncbi:MAG: hypothetical protein LC808_13945 [Actinobacteria bacterium]|nr:hypothetical protein [Actinomycetota bacterium]
MVPLADDPPVDDQADLAWAADVEVVVQDLLEEDPPETGWPSIWVGENSACRIASSYP